MFFLRGKKNNHIFEILENDEIEIRVIKKWAKIISDIIAQKIDIEKDKSIKEIFMFLYAITDLYLVMKNKGDIKRRRIFQKIDECLVKTTDKSINIKDIFDDRIKNYGFLVSKNRNTFNENYINLCQDYQVELLGKIFEKNEFSTFNTEISRGENTDIIQSRFTRSKIMLALICVKNCFLDFIFELDGQDIIALRRKIIGEMKEMDVAEKFSTIIKSYDRYNANEIIDIFNFRINNDYKLIEYNLYNIESSYENYIRCLVSIPKNSDIKKMTDDEIFDCCHERKIFHEIDCIYEKEALWSYFLLQYTLNKYINSDELYTSYNLIFDLNEIQEYKKLLAKKEDLSQEYKEMIEYPVKLLDSESMHIGIFTDERDGIFFKIISIKPKEFYCIKYSKLLKKGKYADVLF